jgi:hypothetical protein
MRVSYRTLAYSRGSVELPATATVSSLRTSVSAALGLSVPDIILIFHSSLLPDTATLASLSLSPTDFILVHSPSIASTFQLRPPERPPEPEPPAPDPLEERVIHNMVSYICDEVPGVRRIRALRALHAARFDPDEAIRQILEQDQNLEEGEADLEEDEREADIEEEEIEQEDDYMGYA